MRKLLIVLFIFVVLVAVTSPAQERVDVVYLKDGSIIRGTIVEQVPGETIRIKTSGGSEFVFQMEEVKRITSETVEEEKDSSQDNNDEEDSSKESNTEALQALDTSFSKNMSLSDLSQVEIKGAWINQTTRLDRRSVYRDYEKDDAGLAFGLNFLLPAGVGSYIQGDTNFAVYRTISDLLFIGTVVFAASTTYTDCTGDYCVDYVYSDGEAIAIALTGLNSSISAIVGWIRPFTYENNYNETLEEKLGL
jgi:hypothetical protein